MPARFNMLSTAIWNREFRNLTGPAKVVFFYIASCRVRVTEGLFELPIGIMLHDTGLKEEHLRAGLDELDRAGLTSYDEATEVVLDRTALKFNPLRNGTSTDKTTGEVTVRPDNRIKSAVNLFGEVPDCDLKGEFVKLAKEHSPDLFDALVERFGSGIIPRLWPIHDADDLPDLPDSKAPSKPLASPSEAPSSSSSELSSYEKGEVGQGCKVEDCGDPPVWRDPDGDDLLCDRHKGSAFGEVVRLAGVA